MNALHPRSLYGLARGLHRRSLAVRDVREQRSFRPRLTRDPNAPELLLSPHWDDAVLDCWSLLASDRELAVVNVFAGVPDAGRLTAWDEITGATDSAERARERIAEDGIALARAGRSPLNLPLLDAQYRRSPSALRLRDIDRALGEVVASASRVYVTAGIGSHVDHVLALRYGRVLLAAGMPVAIYAEVPYCIAHGWPSWVDGRAPEPNRDVDVFWRSFLADIPEMPPLRSALIERLDEPSASAKLQAMRCYETQLPALDYGARALLADPAIHGFEVRWELAGAPRGAADG